MASDLRILKEYFCQYLHYTNVVWAGTAYPNLLFPTRRTIPDTVSIDEYAHTTSVGVGSTSIKIIDVDYFIPYSFGKALIDGDIFTSIAVRQRNTYNTFDVHLTKVIADLRKVDSAGTQTSLVDSSADTELFSGDITTTGSRGTAQDFGFIGYLPVREQEIQPDERLILNIQTWGYGDNTFINHYGYHELVVPRNSTSNSIELQLV